MSYLLLCDQMSCDQMSCDQMSCDQMFCDQMSGYQTGCASAAGGNAQVHQVQRGYAEAVLNETGTQKTTKDQDSGFESRTTGHRAFRHRTIRHP